MSARIDLTRRGMKALSVCSREEGGNDDDCDVDDEFQDEGEACISPSSSDGVDRNTPAFPWMCSGSIQWIILFSLVILAVAYFPQKTNAYKNESKGGDYWQTNKPMFPGMDDHTTKLECCPARVIVELERAYAADQALPHSLLMYNDSESMCGAYIESIENYPGCCGLPPEFTNFGFLTIPEWAKNCILDNRDVNYTGFMYYYDSCPAPLEWQNRSCSVWMDEQVDDPSRDIRVLQRNLSLVEGGFQGTVVEFQNPKWSRVSNSTSVFVPDVFNSCWRLDCSWNGVGAKECVDFAQRNLVQVSLDKYVNITKMIGCE